MIGVIFMNKAEERAIGFDSTARVKGRLAPSSFSDEELRATVERALRCSVTGFSRRWIGTRRKNVEPYLFPL